MRRRDFIKVIAGIAASWPLAVRAQQPAMPVIGYLDVGSPDGSAPFVAAFRKGLTHTGQVEGKNVVIKYRWADGHNDRLPELAMDLVRQKVTVIVTPGSTAAALAAKATTTTIPIIFAIGADPIAAGLVPSLNRPGGNVTAKTTRVVAPDSSCGRYRCATYQSDQPCYFGASVERRAGGGSHARDKASRSSCEQ